MPVVSALSFFFHKGFRKNFFIGVFIFFYAKGFFSAKGVMSISRNSLKWDITGFF